MKQAAEKQSFAVKAKNLAMEYKKHYPLVIMIIPGLIALILFNYLPIYGVTIAFKKYQLLKGITGSQFVGMNNFVKLFSGGDFAHIFAKKCLKTVLELS